MRERAVTARTDGRRSHLALAPNAVGLVALVLFAITTAGPALSADSGLVVSADYAGGSTPLAVVLATAAMMLVAASLGQLAKHLPSAGGLYTYTSNGLGKVVGFVAGWLLLLGYVLVPPLVILVFAYVLQANLTASENAPTWIWAPIAAGVLIIGWALTLRGVRISTRAGVILGVLEILIFVVFAIQLIVLAGHHNTLRVFGTNVGNSSGLGSVFVAMIYAVLAFIGFDGVASMAEETKQPRRNVPRALIWSTLAMGVFWLLCYYAASVYFGPNKMASDFGALNGGDPWSGLAHKLWGGGWILILVAVLSSAFASSTNSANAGTRIAYSLGRTRLLPRQLGLVHPRWRTPHIALTVQAVITLGLMLGLGYGLHSPETAFAFIGTVLTILFVVVYGVVCIACIAYFWRQQRSEFNVFLHFVVPLLGVAFMVPVLLASLGIDFGGLGIAPLTGDLTKAPVVAGVWLLIGIVVLVVVQLRDPDRLTRMRSLFVDDQAAAPAELDQPAAAPRDPVVGVQP
jgi:amino acid transporter